MDDITNRYSSARWMILRGAITGSTTTSTYEFCRAALGDLNKAREAGDLDWEAMSLLVQCGFKNARSELLRKRNSRKESYEFVVSGEWGGQP